MKLRIRGNSIRLRLLKSEVGQLAETGEVSESTDFPGGAKLSYRLVSDADLKEVSAGFENGVVSVFLPSSEADNWAGNDDRVGIEADVNGLSILVEKDFACLTREDDPDNLDAFPNPDLVCT